MHDSDLPLVRELVCKYNPNARKIHLVIVTHVLPTALPFFELLASRFHLSVIGIPYSADRPTVSRLQEGGCRVLVPTELSELPSVALNTILELARSGQFVILQEVGGYLAEFAAELARYRTFLGVVEDTANGHWRYAERSARLSYPVLSIARSPIKAIESLRIGDAVAFSIERVLRRHFHVPLRGTQVLVLGFGRIGSSCASAIRARNANPSIFDIDAVALMRAAMEGFRIGPLDVLLSQADIIIGATGRPSIGSSLYSRLKPGAILASASSRQVEFDLTTIVSQHEAEPHDDDVQHVVLDCGTSFYLLTRGFPINFRDGSIIGSVLDPIYGELFLCVREIAEGRAGDGLRDSDAKLHQEIAEAWVRLYGSHLNG